MEAEAMSYTLLLGDCIEVMKTLPANSVQCCVTSPPYFGLRSYLDGDDPDKPLEIGTEETPEIYIARLVLVFREVRRLLRDDGVLWLNLGDSYASNGPKSNNNGLGGSTLTTGTRMERRIEVEEMKGKNMPNKLADGYKPKDLLGIPWAVAFALRADGWWLRSEIIWHKKAPMPESVTDRPTKAHEQVFLLTKAANYYYDADAIREPMSAATRERDKNGFNGAFKGQFRGTPNEERYQNGRAIESPKFFNEAGRNKRSVWTLGPESYSGAHFATMPTKLVEPCILAGSKVGDTVLDPFCGSGTTLAVALKHHRNGIAIDLNADYLELAHDRIRKSQPMLLAVTP